MGARAALGKRLQVVVKCIDVALDRPADLPTDLDLPPDEGRLTGRTIKYGVNDAPRRNLADLLGADN